MKSVRLFKVSSAIIVLLLSGCGGSRFLYNGELCTILSSHACACRAPSGSVVEHDLDYCLNRIIVTTEDFKRQAAYNVKCGRAGVNP